MSRQMRWQLAQQRERLSLAQESNTPRRLLQEPNRRGTIEPFPVAHATAQNRPQERQVPIDRRVAASFRLLRLDDRINQRPIDALQLTIGQKAMKPTQHPLVVPERGLVSLLAKPTHDCVLPDSLRSVAETLDAPDFAFQLVVELRGLLAVGGLSRSSYSLAVWRDEVDPPHRRLLALD
jgi:hypothetical protein